MKSVEDLFTEIMSDENLKKDFLEFAKNNKLQDFIKNHDCSASKEEIDSFLKSKFNKTGELNDEDLSYVSGGCKSSFGDWLYSIFAGNIDFCDIEV